jgi:hypothetical protein
MSKLIDVIGKNFALKNTTKRINGVPVEIKAYLDVDTFGSIVQTVAQSSFTDGEYHAENREIARRYCIIKYMTDIELEDTDVAEIFKTTQGGNNWYGAIESDVVKLPVWGEVETAIDKQIDYLIGTRQTTFDKLCADLSAILSVDTKADLADVKEVLKDLTKVDKDEFVDAVIKKNTKKKSAQ